MFLFADWMVLPLESTTPDSKRIQILAWNFLIESAAHKKKINLIHVLI